MNVQRQHFFWGSFLTLILVSHSCLLALPGMPKPAVAEPEPSDASAVQPAPKDVPPPPAPEKPTKPKDVVAPLKAQKGGMVDDTGSTNKLLPATPIFTATKSQGVGTVKQKAVMPRKEMFAKSENEERRIREIVARIDTVKSTQLNEYLKLDKELDQQYEEIGLARGHAADDIMDIKESLWQDVLDRTVNASDALQGKIEATRAKLDRLESEVKALTEREGDVVARLKELSDETVSAFDKAAQVFNKRSELPGIMNDQTAEAIFNEIKSAPEAIDAIEKGLTKPEGIVSRFEKAMADARAQMNVVKGLLDELKKEDVDVASKLAKVADESAAVAQDLKGDAGEAMEDAPVEETSVMPKKKRKKSTKSGSWIPEWVSADILYKAYDVVVQCAAAIWEILRPVRIFFTKIYNHVAHKLFGAQPIKTSAPAATTVKDPVLARIAIEREQSQKKVNDLAYQRKLIREKEELLDRLEVERVMQLDGKDEVAAQLDRSYRHGKAKELGWIDLGKRFAWKLYASFRRSVIRLTQWWSEARAESAGTTLKRPTKKAVTATQAEQDDVAEPMPVAETTSQGSDFDAQYDQRVAELEQGDAELDEEMGYDEGEEYLDDEDEGELEEAEASDPSNAVGQALARRQYKLSSQEKAAEAFAKGGADKAKHAADLLMSKKEQDAAAQRAKDLVKGANAAIKAVQKSAAAVTATTVQK